MTPRIRLTAPRVVNCTVAFANKGQLQSPGSGELALKGMAQGTAKLVMVVLKDILWVPGLPCRLLSIGAIRSDGGELVDFRAKAIYYENE